MNGIIGAMMWFQVTFFLQLVRVAEGGSGQVLPEQEPHLVVGDWCVLVECADGARASDEHYRRVDGSPVVSEAPLVLVVEVDW